MADYLGDYAEDGSVFFTWDTNDGSGGSITRSTDGTISVYKDGGLTQITTGITDTEDFDSLTGVHSCVIDLSSTADYATGSDYSVVLSAATIDSQTVNATLKLFSIQNRSFWSYGTRTLTQGAASVTAAVSGSSVTVYRGTTWIVALTGLGDISTYDTIYCSVKTNYADSEDDAILRVKDDASGLLRFNGAAPAAATNGVITIDDASAGDITITIKEAETVSALVANYVYDIKGIDDDGDVIMLSAGGSWDVSGDITQAITS